MTEATPGKPKHKRTFFIILIIFSVYVIGYQIKGNRDIVEDHMDALEKAEQREPGHPMLIINKSLYKPYVSAYDQIQKSPDKDFWLVGWDLDPSIILNYHVYPKRLFMSEDTQMQLHAKNLLLAKDPIDHQSPKEFQKVVIIESETARISDEWDLNP